MHVRVAAVWRRSKTPPNVFHRERFFARLLIGFSIWNVLFCAGFTVLDIHNGEWEFAIFMVFIGLVNLLFTIRLNIRTLRRIRARGY